VQGQVVVDAELGSQRGAVQVHGLVADPHVDGRLLGGFPARQAQENFLLALAQGLKPGARRGRLLQVAAEDRLEDRYAGTLATSDSRTPAAWKREIRKQLRDAGFDSPSESATAFRAEHEIKELD
jgi:hypothetical protein